MPRMSARLNLSRDMMILNQRSITVSADKTAIALSSICAVHCLLVPVMVSLFPSLLASGLQDERIHIALLFFVVPVSVIGLAMGCQQHRNLGVIGLGVAGISLLILSGLFGHGLGGKWLEVTGTLVGTGLVAVSHIVNFRLSQNLTDSNCAAHSCAAHE